MLPIDTSTYSFDPLFINIAAGALVNVAKHSDHPLFKWISDATPWVSRSLHTMVAAISAAGMTISYATAEDGSMSITLAGITFTSVATFLFTSLKNFLGQAGTSVFMDGVRRQIEIHEMLIDLKQQVNEKGETQYGLQAID